jgi:tRNA pseudouridine55 synthase
MKKFDINDKDQIFAIWKPLGLSTHVISKQVSGLMRVPVAHTGTLDPMAEGVIVLLSGEERFKKYELAGWKKEYEFEILFGLSTDTFDLLGFNQQIDLAFKLDETNLDKALETFTKTYEQTYPPFSAKKVKGKPLHYYAQKNTLHTIERPTISATIFELSLMNVAQVDFEQIYSTATERIKMVEGFFRQDAILNDWEMLLTKIPHNTRFHVAKVRAVVSRGVYVRTLAVDIAKYLNTVAVVSNLVRTKNGMYTKAECMEYEQIIALRTQAE